MAWPSYVRFDHRCDTFERHCTNFRFLFDWQSVPWIRVPGACHIEVVLTNRINLISLQWLIMILYGIAAALFAYCVSLMVASPLAAFAVVAGYQFIIFTVCHSSSKY